MRGARLVGGRFDGERQHATDDAAVEDMAPLIWVWICKGCKETHWDKAEHSPGEMYRREELDQKGWLRYIFCDERLMPRGEMDERELVPAGGEHQRANWT